MKKIILRHMQISDFESYYELNKPSRKHHELNGPYYKKDSEVELKDRINKMKFDIINGNVKDNSLVIADKINNELIGSVSYYWKSKETMWLEIGIVIFNEDYWGLGIGSQALKLWIDKIFNEKKNIVRLGLTTWSGNKGMIHLAEKLGLVLEATYRKARIVNGEYFDSISYGILREEWDSYQK